MEERLNIVIKDQCGSDYVVSSLKSKTIREVINDVMIRHPSNKAYPKCTINGNKVQIDKTLSSLNIRDGETIFVTFPRIRRKDEEDEERKKRLSTELFVQALRIVDMQYNDYDFCGRNALLYDLSDDSRDGNEGIGFGAFPESEVLNHASEFPRLW